MVLRTQPGRSLIVGFSFFAEGFFSYEEVDIILGQVIITQLLFYSLFFNENQFSLLFLFNIS